MQSKSTFITKLWTILNDTNFSKFLIWGKDGTTFLVLNQEEFSGNVLPQIFKHNNFASFVRQLNLYGFNKVNRCYHKSTDPSTESIPMEFKNPQFIKGKVDEIYLIKRKTSYEEGVRTRLSNKLRNTKTESESSQEEEITKDSPIKISDSLIEAAKNFQSPNLQEAMQNQMRNVQEKLRNFTDEINFLRKKSNSQTLEIENLKAYLMVNFY